MPLVNAKCTNCGSNLLVDNAKDAAVCPHCKSAYIVEKAINNYNISNTNNITADVVNIYGGNSADFVIRAGELIRYNGAQADVVIPNTVTKIGGNSLSKDYQGAFQDCSQLKSVIIPDGVTVIEQDSFKGCHSLTSITIPTSVEYIHNSAFESCRSLLDITIPSQAIAIYRYTFAFCYNLRSVTIPDGMLEICDHAFCHCSRLKSVEIPEGVRKIGDSAFEGCSSLVEIKIPEGVSEIGNSAFEGCSSLVEIKIPEGVSKVGSHAFKNCESLTDIKWPNSLIELGEEAFCNCVNLEEISIPENVMKCIHLSCFDGCVNLHTVIFQEGVERVFAFAFRNGPALESMTFPDSCTFENHDTLHHIVNEDLYYSVKTVNASEQWKKKHAEEFDCLKSYRSKSGCYIATAVYGSYDCPEVWTLRRFRDYSLAETWHGRAFIKLYYAISPTVVKYFGHTKWFTRLFRHKLDKFVAKLQTEGVEDTPYYDR